MATFTSAQLLSLLDALSESKLTSKQFAKKVVKMKKVLDKGGDFDKVIDGCRSTKPKSKAWGTSSKLSSAVTEAPSRLCACRNSLTRLPWGSRCIKGLGLGLGSG